MLFVAFTIFRLVYFPNMSESNQDSTSPVVRKSNQLINARYGDITPTEAKYLFMMVSQISDDDEDYKTYEISTKDLVELSGSSSRDLFARAEEITDKILTRIINIPEKDGLVKVSPISYAKHIKGKGIIRLRFDPVLKPYLIDLKDNYTSYKLQYAVKLRSIYSIRMYEILKSHEWKIRKSKTPVKIKYELEELKEMLSSQGKYKSYNLFKTRILEHVRKELKENCDITFSFKEIKTGRKVTHIELTLIAIKTVNVNVTSPENANILDKLIHYGVSRRQAQEFVVVNDPAYLEEIIAYSLDQDSKGEVKNLGGYIVHLIKNKAQVGKSAHQKEKDNKEQKTKQEAIDAKEAKARSEQIIEELKAAYQDAKKKEIDHMVSNFSEDDNKNLEEFCRNNPFLSSRLFEDGNLMPDKDKSMYETALSMFLTQDHKHFKSDDDGFMRWVLDTKGHHLKKDHSRKSNYRIEATQTELFS
ncbi:MAG: RepB family plasmid replication initiator protein [Bacteroidota bacterium]